jgi:hypothetical protein
MTMASNDDNKCKYDDEELSAGAKRKRLGDDGSDDSFSGESEEETTEANTEPQEVSSKEEMNKLDSEEIKLFQRWARCDNNTPSESEGTSIENTSVGSEDCIDDDDYD